MPGTRLRGLGAAGNKYHTFAGRCLSQIGIQRRQGYSLTLSQFQIGGIVYGQSISAGQVEDCVFVGSSVHAESKQ